MYITALHLYTIAVVKYFKLSECNPYNLLKPSHLGVDALKTYSNFFDFFIVARWFSIIND